MTTATIKNKNYNKEIDYRGNINRLLDWESLDLKVLKTSAGMLKNVLSTRSPVQYQRKLRKEWERKLKTKN